MCWIKCKTVLYKQKLNRSFSSLLDNHTMWDFPLASEEKAKNLILKKGTTFEKEMAFASKVFKRQNPQLLLENNFWGFFIIKFLWFSEKLRPEFFGRYYITSQKFADSHCKSEQKDNRHHFLALTALLVLKLLSEVKGKY